MASVRDYAILWVGGQTTGGLSAMGGNAIIKTGQHRLDGPEHTTADDTSTLDSSTDAHGLMPKLSGDPDKFFNGEGDQVVPDFASALDDLTDVTITSGALADRLRFDGSIWRNSALIWTPMTVFDPTTGNYLPLVDGAGNQIMAEA